MQELPNEDPSTSSLESIVDTMLNHMLAGTSESVTRQELKSLIFATAEMDLLASTVQATTTAEGGGFAVNQNW